MARIARSLEVLRNQVNQLAPNRSKGSDGWLGDSAHAARTSDHNPNSAGVVTALDITHDPAHGMSSYTLAEQLLASKDARIIYFFSYMKFASGTGQDHPAWVWRSYTGSNPHDMHCHVSVKSDAASYDNASQWVIKAQPSSGETPPDNNLPVLERGSTGDLVKLVQQALMVDGIFGPMTEQAVEEFQLSKGLDPDGIVGPYTWRELLNANPVVMPSDDKGWQTGIFATVFGGTSDPNTSAYDGHNINDSELGVALPARVTTREVEVRNANSRGRVITCKVVDVGPWLTDDTYWTTNSRPIAEDKTMPLPRGPNKGKRSNGAGIDLTPAVARALGLEGNGKVDWRFKPTGTPMNGTIPTTNQTQGDQATAELIKIIHELMAAQQARQQQTIDVTPTPTAPKPSQITQTVQGLSSLFGLATTFMPQLGAVGIGLQVLASVMGYMGPMVDTAHQAATTTGQVTGTSLLTMIAVGVLNWIKTAATTKTAPVVNVEEVKK